MGKQQGLVGRWAARPILDYVLGIVVAVVAYRWWDHHNIDALDATGRRAVYQTSTAAATALFGLTLTSVSILLSNAPKPAPGFAKGLPSGTVVGIARSMFALLRTLAVFLVGSFVLLIVDDASGPWHCVHTLFVAFACVVVVRLSRVAFLLSEFVKALHPSKPSQP